MFQENPIKT